MKFLSFCVDLCVAGIDRSAKLREKCKVAAETRTKHFAQHFPRSHTHNTAQHTPIYIYVYIYKKLYNCVPASPQSTD